MQLKTLSRKAGLYLIGNFSSKILSALLLPIYAFYIVADDLGYFDLMQTLMGICIPITFLAIWEAILRFLLGEKDEKSKKVIISTTAFFTILISGIVCVVFIILNHFKIIEIKSIELIIGMFLSTSFAQIWQYYARAFGESKVFVWSGILGTIINFIFVLIFIVVFKTDLTGLFISYILGQVAIFLIIEFKVRVISTIKIGYINIHVLWKMLKFSQPLVLNLISTWLIIGFGRLIITMELGTEANGLFSFASKFSLIVTMIGSVVTMAIIEEAILAAKTKGLDSSFGRTMEVLFKIFQLIILLAVPAIVIFYKSIENTDYYNSLQYAPWLLLFSVAKTMASNIGSAFQAINKTKYQFTTTIIGAIVTVIFSYSFISSLGIYAVVIGQILGAIIMLLTRYNLLKKYIDIEINWKPILWMSVLFIITTIICLNTHYIFSCIAFIFILVFACFTNLRTLKASVKEIKNKLKK
ncbi:lipopolysaccharide biosynthesis protein [Peribacillus frigoritolerans]|uniref:lipopolysaccharide biosynthesis protein n=1 Tax=Peribacillus frigoritolerans TaxID=450367 RepID=UPI00227EAC6F|nr:oligosaccharide flippase family protein [Peribacillus frigoritolerans]MCY9006774.1 oligosaccharide flippase family protein [Peribacillus frigoritolerans]